MGSHQLGGIWWDIERAHDFPPYWSGGSLALSVTARLLTMAAMADCAPLHAGYRVDKALRPLWSCDAQ
jgi:hypothetical protein